MKAPPGKLGAGGVEHPVRLEPIEDVVVAGEKHGLRARPAPGFGKRAGADLGNLAVDHGGELVYHHAGRGLAEHARQVGAELLPGGEHPVGAQPGGHVAQADLREGAGDLVEVSLRRDAVHDRLVGRPVVGLVEGLASPERAAQARLAGARGPTITPMLQSGSSGISATRSKLAPDSALKRLLTRAAR